MKIVAPWTKDQIRSLNAWQRREDFHSFTCGKCDIEVPLFATTQGWECQSLLCDYTQDWAHDFMVHLVDELGT